MRFRGSDRVVVDLHIDAEVAFNSGDGIIPVSLPNSPFWTPAAARQSSRMQCLSFVPRLSSVIQITGERDMSPQE